MLDFMGVRPLARLPLANAAYATQLKTRRTPQNEAIEHFHSELEIVIEECWDILSIGKVLTTPI